MVIDQDTDWKYTSPETWSKILAEHPELKINFGHFGVRRSGKTDWLKDILGLIYKYDNVYADFSYNGVEEAYYFQLVNTISEYADKNFSGQSDKEKFLNKLSERILFGTDFMINLLDIDSYESYLQIFIQTEAFAKLNFDMKKFYTGNAYTFVFGK